LTTAEGLGKISDGALAPANTYSAIVVKVVDVYGNESTVVRELA